MSNPQSTLRSRLASTAKAWGPASFSYFAVFVCQVVLAISLDGFASVVMGFLAVTSVLLACAHKGRTFDEFQAKSSSPIKFPWTHRASQMALCAGLVLLCAMLPQFTRPGFEWLTHVGMAAAVLAGWCASITPKAVRAAPPSAPK